MLEKSNSTPRHKYSAIKARYFSALNLINSSPKNPASNKNGRNISVDPQSENGRTKIQKRHTVSNPVVSNSYKENHMTKNNKRPNQNSQHRSSGRKIKKTNSNNNNYNQNNEEESDLYNKNFISGTKEEEEEEEEALVITKSNLFSSRNTNPLTNKKEGEDQLPKSISSPIIIKNANKSKLTAALLLSPRNDSNNSSSQEQKGNNDEDIFNSQVTTDFINTAYSCPLINTNSDSMFNSDSSSNKSFLEVVNDEDDEDFGEFVPPHLLSNRNTFSFYQHRRNVKYMTNI